MMKLFQGPRIPLVLRIALFIGVLLLLDIVTFWLAEGLWFQEVDYLQVFTTRLVLQVGVSLVISAISLSFLGIHLRRANRQAWPSQGLEVDRPLAGQMGMKRLFPLVIALSSLIGLLVLYHGQIAARSWQAAQHLDAATTAIPRPFSPQLMVSMVQSWPANLWQPIVVLLIGLALLFYPTLILATIAICISLSWGLVLSEHWTTFLLALHPTEFNQVDPLFQLDLGFYIFVLPLWDLLEFWLVGLSALTLLSVLLTYVLSGDSLSQGQFPGFSGAQQQHLYGLGAILLLIIASSYWRDRYNLLYSPEGAAYGASFTSVTVNLPAYTCFSLLALGIGVWLGLKGVLMGRKPPHPFIEQTRPEPGRQDKPVQGRRYPVSQVGRAATPTQKTSPSLRLVLWVLGGFALGAVLVGNGLPQLIQQFVVQPNELQLEQPYLQRTIAFTRAAFNLTGIDAEPFDPQGNLTYSDLQTNNLTVKNIRLWDKRPLLETNRQLQRIRLYYEFPDADIDRYTLPQRQGESAQQQVLIAARELNYADVPSAARTWVNEHLIYTHGYGFTVSPVNVAGEGGLPDYFIQGIEPVIVDPRVRDSIPVGKPRIYYGELTNTYVMTNTRLQELDYPSGSDNIYNVYDGKGGVNIGAWWQRLVFAKHMRDWQMLLTDDFTPKTQLLYRRNIQTRVKAIAPFLQFDRDPYLVTVNSGDKSWARGYQRGSRSGPDGLAEASAATPDQSYLYWVLDAYTISDHFPYSDPAGNPFNYIRNSVKAVVDAYHGLVTFYVADPSDPLIQTWQKIFPGMFLPLEQMPPALLQHVRYPQDLYRVQTEQLMTYHMTDPIVFYNREDQWRAPNEIYGDKQQVVEPYYLIMKLPTAASEEFILLRPFTPIQRNNLIAWMAARSDGQEYGKMLLYDFPKQKLIFGPEQIEARINQDPVISQRISLWNRQGSRAVQGNLLVIPIEQSLLYVEPLYLEATQNQLPTLVRVIVAYGNRIAMSDTLENSLNAIFQAKPAAAPIVRPLDDDSLGTE